MAETNPDCAAMQAEINELQTEFDGLWIKMSTGGGDPTRYRQLRHILDDKRAEFQKKCGAPSESTTLPRSITADWRG
jgi:hypothetical protein